ncbi:MAG: M23 family metallopeptidase [Salinibacterium sp.]|nr:M23 family metallopeptidase [Salinibacterium sp.]
MYQPVLPRTASLKSVVTLGAVATLLVGVSIPAAAVGGSRSVYLSAPETPIAPTVVETQEFSSAYLAEAAPVVRDAFGVETIVEAPTISFSSITGSLVMWPANASVNDGFGYRDGNEFHGGIDIMAAYGTTIVAASPGTVIAVASDSGWGSYVKIDHGGGVYTLYAHMISGTQSVSVGQFVNAGDALGLVGQTGYASVPHLHFEVYAGGSRVDPMGWLP